MFQTHLDLTANRLTIDFQEKNRVRTIEYTVRSQEHANQIWRFNVAKYIVATLTRWLNHREWTLKYVGDMTTQKSYAIDAIRTMLTNYGESKVEAVVRQVNKHADDFFLLAPGQSSRYYHQYNCVIAPLIRWCQSKIAAHSATQVRH